MALPKLGQQGAQYGSQSTTQMNIPSTWPAASWDGGSNVDTTVPPGTIKNYSTPNGDLAAKACKHL